MRFLACVAASIFVLGIGSLPTPAQANDVPLEKVIELSTRLSTVEASLDTLLCLALASDNDAKAECAGQPKKTAAADVAALTTTLSNELKKTDIEEVDDLTARIGVCVGKMDAFVQSPGQGPIDEFDKNCSQAGISQQLKETGNALREGLETCAKSATQVRDFLDANNSRPILEVARAATKNLEDLPDKAKKCVAKVSAAADAVSKSIGGFEKALASTLAFCATIPEPYSCGIFAAIQLLMALFESGGGGGEGSGDGSGSGGENGTAAAGKGLPGDSQTGQQGTKVGTNTNQGTLGQNGSGTEVAAEVRTGDDCVIVRVASDLVCQNGEVEMFRAVKYFDGAEFRFADGTPVRTRTAIAEHFAKKAFYSIDSYFGTADMIPYLSRNEMAFCVNIVPGLDKIFIDTKNEQPNKKDEELITAVLLSPVDGSPGVYVMQFEHDGGDC